MPRPTIILDCDPGHDDAMAIILAARHADLVGITTVNGNAPLGRTTANALVMTQLLDIDVPVHSGAAHPLLAAAINAPQIHGESGMDGAQLPTVTRRAASTDAIGFIIESVRAHEGMWLVPTGPLTNIALALRAAPDLAGRLAGISLMGGGSTYGNRTPAAEFNIWCDPEAAAIVFGAGCRTIMSGLNLTHQVLASPTRIDAVRAIGTPLATIIADLLAFFSGTYMSIYDDRFVGAPVHDACAVLALTHPELFRGRPAHVDIEVDGHHTRGMTLVDLRPFKEPLPPNVELLEHVDADAVFALLTDAIASFG
jgi:inosine-uridine nucleoside N-ribohydrolase